MSHNRLSKKLVWAIKNRCTERVERLLKKRADVSNATDKNGDTAFVLACNAGSVEIIKILVDMGVVNLKDYHDDIIHKAFVQAITVSRHTRHETVNYIASLKLLLESGADVNRNTGCYYETPLKLACSHMSVETVKLLLNKGANVNVKDIHGNTALTDMSYDIVGMDDKSSFTPEYFSWNYNIVSLLLQNGADLNAKDNEGQTALMMLCNHNNYKSYMVVSLLLQNGADVNIKNNYGMTALRQASEQGYTEFVALLLNNGADINEKDKWSNTALKVACTGGHTHTVSYLLKKGADVNTRDSYGNTALDSSSKYGRNKEEIVPLIKNHIRRIELMKQVLKTALIIKKGLTKKKDKPLIPYAHREIIHRIASFF